MKRKYSRCDWMSTVALGAMMLCSAASTWPSLAATSAQTADASFAAGDRVVALVRTPVKASPDDQQALALPLPGGQGTIEEGPLSSGGERWWRVAFDEGFAGWTREGDLQAHEPGVKAFPTAEGFGAKALGGRGGVVIEVTNLDDSGPGSLRDAVEREGPRTIVFRVGGTIAVERPIRVRDPYITIAGQTAPGDGILIRNHRANTEAPITIETHDVVIRYLRLRPGPSGEPSCCVDALGLMQGARNVMIDHVSLSWGVDEVLGASEDASDFTVQWSILSEALRRGGHAKDERHSRGLLVSTQEGGNVSIHHNLFAHNEGRNPEVALGLRRRRHRQQRALQPELSHDRDQRGQRQAVRQRRRQHHAQRQEHQDRQPRDQQPHRPGPRRRRRRARRLRDVRRGQYRRALPHRRHACRRRSR